jgi:hypothetical protein
MRPCKSKTYNLERNIASKIFKKENFYIMQYLLSEYFTLFLDLPLTMAVGK